MRTPLFMLVCLMGMWVVLGISLFQPRAANVTGVDHSNPEFEVLKQGGSGAERHGTFVSVCAWAFACLQACFYLGCLLLGLQRPRVKPASLWPLYVYTALMLVLLTAVFVVYRAGLENPHTVAYWGPFPASTALVLFGVWLLPLIVVAFYTLRFDTLVYTPEDAERFKLLLKRRKQVQSGRQSLEGTES